MVVAASDDFSALTRKAASEQRAADGRRAGEQAEAADAREREASDAAERFAAALRECGEELRRLDVPHVKKGAFLDREKGWFVPLCISDRWDEKLRVWVDMDPRRRPKQLPVWSLIVGGGAGSDPGGSVRVVLDPTSDGGLRCDIDLAGEPPRSEPLRSCLARGVARLAARAG